MATPARNVLRPFRSGTRKRLTKAGTITFAVGTAANALTLPEVGYLCSVYVNLRGTMNVQNATSIANRGPWDLLKRAQLNLNIGSSQIFDLSGYGTYVVNTRIERDYAPNAGDGISVTPHPDVYAAGVAAGDNTYSLWYHFPVAVNEGLNNDTGLINLQSPLVQCDLNLTFGANTDGVAAVGTGTGFAGTAHVYTLTMDVPPVDRYAQPPILLHRFLEQRVPITGLGDNEVKINRLGSLLGLAHIVQINGSRSDVIDSLRLQMNTTDTPVNMERQWMRMVNRKESGVHLPVGVYYHDFFHAWGNVVSMGDNRDLIDSERLTDLRSIITVSSTASLGSNNNFIDTIRRLTQVVQVRKAA